MADENTPTASVHGPYEDAIIEVCAVVREGMNHHMKFREMLPEILKNKVLEMDVAAKQLGFDLFLQPLISLVDLAKNIKEKKGDS